MKRLALISVLMAVPAPAVVPVETAATGHAIVPIEGSAAYADLADEAGCSLSRPARCDEDGDRTSGAQRLEASK